MFKEDIYICVNICVYGYFFFFIVYIFESIYKEREEKFRRNNILVWIYIFSFEIFKVLLDKKIGFFFFLIIYINVNRNNKVRRRERNFEN